jgi:hypothetical protein
MVFSRECLAVVRAIVFASLSWPFAYRFRSFHTIPKIAMAAIGGTEAE